MADDPYVTFDVGGKVFKTSRSLILQHEDSMLVRLVSATWQEDPTKPVFIDRDGDTFRCVLDFLRYGNITLPMTVSREMFLRDMDFYGIVHNEGTVKTSSEAWAAQVKNRHDEIRDLENEKNKLALFNQIEMLANHCADRWLAGSCVVEFKTGSYVAKKDNLCRALKSFMWEQDDSDNNEMFQKSLSKFGLKAIIVPTEGIKLSLM